MGVGAFIIKINKITYRLNLIAPTQARRWACWRSLPGPAPQPVITPTMANKAGLPLDVLQVVHRDFSDAQIKSLALVVDLLKEGLARR